MINLIQQLRMEANNLSNRKQSTIEPGDILSITTTQYKNKKRKQIIKGVCLGVTNRVGGTTIRIRNIIAGEGVEQTFLLASPIINQIETTDKSKTGKRAKKYYIRDRSPSESKV